MVSRYKIWVSLLTGAWSVEFDKFIQSLRNNNGYGGMD